MAVFHPMGSNDTSLRIDVWLDQNYKAGYVRREDNPINRSAIPINLVGTRMLWWYSCCFRCCSCCCCDRMLCPLFIPDDNYPTSQTNPDSSKMARRSSPSSPDKKSRRSRIRWTMLPSGRPCVTTGQTLSSSSLSLEDGMTNVAGTSIFPCLAW